MFFIDAVLFINVGHGAGRTDGSNGKMNDSKNGCFLWLTGLAQYRDYGWHEDDEFIRNIKDFVLRNECEVHDAEYGLREAFLAIGRHGVPTLVVYSKVVDIRRLSAMVDFGVRRIIFLCRPQNIAKHDILDLAIEHNIPFITQQVPQIDFLQQRDFLGQVDSPSSAIIEFKPGCSTGYEWKRHIKNTCKKYIPDLLVGILGNIITGGCGYLNFFG